MFYFSKLVIWGSSWGVGSSDFIGQRARVAVPRPCPPRPRPRPRDPSPPKEQTSKQQNKQTNKDHTSYKITTTHQQQPHKHVISNNAPKPTPPEENSRLGRGAGGCRRVGGRGRARPEASQTAGYLAFVCFKQCFSAMSSIDLTSLLFSKMRSAWLSL